MKSERDDSEEEDEMSRFTSLVAPKKNQGADQAASALTPLQLFTKLALKSEKLDVVMLSDLIYTVNFCC